MNEATPQHIGHRLEAPVGMGRETLGQQKAEPRRPKDSRWCNCVEPATTCESSDDLRIPDLVLGLEAGIEMDQRQKRNGDDVPPAERDLSTQCFGRSSKLGQWPAA